MADADSSFLATVKFVSLVWWDATSSDDERYKAWLYFSYSATAWPGSC